MYAVDGCPEIDHKGCGFSRVYTHMHTIYILYYNNTVLGCLRYVLFLRRITRTSEVGPIGDYRVIYLKFFWFTLHWRVHRLQFTTRVQDILYIMHTDIAILHMHFTDSISLTCGTVYYIIIIIIIRVYDIIILYINMSLSIHNNNVHLLFMFISLVIRYSKLYNTYIIIIVAIIFKGAEVWCRKLRVVQ